MPSSTQTSGIELTPTRGRLQCWITYKNTSVVLGTLPKNFYVDRANIHVTQAFNAGSSNNLSIGYGGAQQAFVTNTACGSTGVKSVTMGANLGVNTSSVTAAVYFTQTGASATAGKAFVELYLHPIPPSP